MIELIKELRARTHLGLTECKKALEESGGDIEKAIEALQKKGLKKIDDLVLPTEGIVQASVVTVDKNHLPYGFIVEVNCQTDFGARSELFKAFVNDLTSQPDLYSNSGERLKLLSNQLGEKVVIRRAGFIKHAGNSVITVYNHLGGKIAVLMESSVVPSKQNDPEILNLLDNVAMQIAANKPLSVSRESLPYDLVQKKAAFYEEEVKFKPEQVKNKILDGKMTKWYSEVVLLEQDAIFVGDNGPKGQTVQKEIDKFGSNGVVVIKQFVRYERGEMV